MEIGNRRNFFKQFAFGSAAFALFPSAIFSDQQGFIAEDEKIMNLKGILPIIFIDDCAQLILRQDGLSEKTKEALFSSIDLEELPGNMSRLAPTMILPDDKIFELLEQLKFGRYDRGSDMEYEDRYSLLLGWIIYSGFRQETGKLYRELIDNGHQYDDIRICHDAFIFREISDNHHVGSSTSREEMAELLNIMLPRMVTRLHTLIPDSHDGMKWVVDMTKWRISNKALMDKYAAEMVSPNQDHVEQFITQPGFYEGRDKIIRLARELQNGENVSASQISSAMESDPGSSIYARALVKGIRKAVLTDQYFSNGDGEFSDFTRQLSRV